MSATACELCGRTTKRGTTEHHLIPRTCHSNKWFKKRFSRQQMQMTVNFCHDCHRAVHNLVPDEKQLGRNLHSLAALRAHPKLQKFIAWIRKQK